MLKTISAALLAASVIVAPALAATPAKTTDAKTTTAPAPVIKVDAAKSKGLNANARMGRHHQKHVRHHRHHSKMGALKASPSAKVATKPVTSTSAAKRG